MANGRAATVVVITSSAPFGISETWLQSELAELAQHFQVLLAPLWRRGAVTSWPGADLMVERFTPSVVRSAVRNLVRSGSFRALLASRDAADVRTAVKMVVSTVRAAMIAATLQRDDVAVVHVVGSIASGPAMAAGVVGQLLGSSSSIIGHRFDIAKRAPRRVLADVDCVRAISVGAQQEFASVGVASVVFPLGVVGSLDQRPRSRTVIRAVCIGSVIERKNHGDAIRAVAVARARGVDATLSIVGTGPLTSSLETLVEELDLRASVVFEGGMDRPVLLARLASGPWNVLVHPSLVDEASAEGIPAAILEGAANGLVVMATPSGSTAEYLHDGANGIVLCQPHGEALVAEIADVWEGIIDGRYDAEQLVANAFESLAPYTSEFAMARLMRECRFTLLS
jgi:hypothetical protein